MKINGMILKRYIDRKHIKNLAPMFLDLSVMKCCQLAWQNDIDVPDPHVAQIILSFGSTSHLGARWAKSLKTHICLK